MKIISGITSGNEAFRSWMIDSPYCTKVGIAVTVALVAFTLKKLAQPTCCNLRGGRQEKNPTDASTGKLFQTAIKPDRVSTPPPNIEMTTNIGRSQEEAAVQTKDSFGIHTLIEGMSSPDFPQWHVPENAFNRFLLQNKTNPQVIEAARQSKKRTGLRDGLVNLKLFQILAKNGYAIDESAEVAQAGLRSTNRDERNGAIQLFLILAKEGNAIPQSVEAVCKICLNQDILQDIFFNGLIYTDLLQLFKILFKDRSEYHSKTIETVVQMVANTQNLEEEPQKKSQLNLAKEIIKLVFYKSKYTKKEQAYYEKNHSVQIKKIFNELIPQTLGFECFYYFAEKDLFINELLEVALDNIKSTDDMRAANGAYSLNDLCRNPRAFPKTIDFILTAINSKELKDIFFLTYLNKENFKEVRPLLKFIRSSEKEKNMTEAFDSAEEALKSQKPLIRLAAVSLFTQYLYEGVGIDYITKLCAKNKSKEVDCLRNKLHAYILMSKHPLLPEELAHKFLP